MSKTALIFQHKAKKDGPSGQILFQAGARANREEALLVDRRRPSQGLLPLYQRRHQAAEARRCPCSRRSRQVDTKGASKSYASPFQEDKSASIFVTGGRYTNVRPAARYFELFGREVTFSSMGGQS